MKTPESEIEDVLRRAPAPTPPADLEDRLREQIHLVCTPVRMAAPSPLSWLRRWWPVLVPAGVSLACGVVFTLQQSQIRTAQQTIQTLSQSLHHPAQAAVEPAAPTVAPANAAAVGEQEIARLKESVARLSAEVDGLDALRAENQRLRTQLASKGASRLAPEELSAVKEAKDKATMWKCSNNLKQLGLAVRVWALDNEDHYSPDVASMSNEISAPITCICPGDTAHQPAADFFHFTSANCSYEYRGAGAKGSDAPNRVIFRCPIHGSVTMSDGSVQMEVGKTHPEDLVTSNGVLYLREHDASAAQR